MPPPTPLHLTRWLAIAVGLASVVGLAACAAPAAPTPTPTPSPTATRAPTLTPTAALNPTWTPIPGNDRSLRSLAARRGLRIGAAAASGYLFAESPYMATLGREFNMLTPETEMKFEVLQPQPGQFEFGYADQLVTFAQANGMTVRGHTLVWDHALPAWLTEGTFSRDEMIEILRGHITTVAGHFRGKVAAWDVVNEAFADDGRYKRNIWLDRIGPEYIEMAFRWAHEADPDALLFYNDYHIDDMGAKSNAAYRLVKDLQSKDIPIDGVGLQMHIRADYPPQPISVKANMERFGELGLKVHITEMDVSTTYLYGAHDAQMKRQAEVYRQVAETCLSVDACSALVVWGVTDRYTWLHGFAGPGDRPLLFDDQYRPKPAFYALRVALEDLREADP